MIEIDLDLILSTVLFLGLALGFIGGYMLGRFGPME